MGEPKLSQSLQQIVSVRVNHLIFINGLQQKELALRLAMSASTLNNKIHGKGSWGLEDAIALGEIFEVSIDYLIGKAPIEAAVPTQQKAPALARVEDLRPTD
ncbi:XRE family transcriptional regulator [Leucobacter muris]|uniref:XRE family transcriptional regulator n=1 Tax=Leucobacter muris TaxID=1935379 RepID=A0ABX5QF27_9MICO|nr:helix-turn-helix transcriptional regulator [Leucobacter muris]QAB17636.1 XRE family transcriptional regulator [Leucobacter muris]